MGTENPSIKGFFSYKQYQIQPVSTHYQVRRMLMKPNNGDTAVHGCHCPGDMAVRMREVLAIQRSRQCVLTC